MAVLGNNIFIATSDATLSPGTSKIMTSDATLSPGTSKIIAGTRSNTINTECGSIEIASANVNDQEWTNIIKGRKSWSIEPEPRQPRHWLVLAERLRRVVVAAKSKPLRHNCLY